jgi:SEP domain
VFCKKEKQATAEGKQNELFIGGIDQKGGGSGLAVVGPPGGGKAPVPAQPDVFDRIFERAQGHSEEDSGSSSSEPSGTRRVITMYRNGFVVDDGPFRDATSPDNQLFIRSLEAGRVPVGAFLCPES